MQIEKHPHCRFTSNRISEENSLTRFKCSSGREGEENGGGAPGIIETEKTNSRDGVDAQLSRRLFGVPGSHVPRTRNLFSLRFPLPLNLIND